MHEIKVLKSTPTEPADKSWLEHLWRSEQAIPNRIEDAAKFLATMISVSFTMFLGIGRVSAVEATDYRVQTAVVLWLIALLLAFVVLFPLRYKLVSQSVSSIKETHRSIAIVKRTLLVLSLISSWQR